MQPQIRVDRMLAAVQVLCLLSKGRKVWAFLDTIPRELTRRWVVADGVRARAFAPSERVVVTPPEFALTTDSNPLQPHT